MLIRRKYVLFRVELERSCSVQLELSQEARACLLLADHTRYRAADFEIMVYYNAGYISGRTWASFTGNLCLWAILKNHHMQPTWSFPAQVDIT